MRFTEKGPSIPNELLQLQQQGNVIFFCGAGISMPDLPGFKELANDVMNKLGVNQRSNIRKSMKNGLPLDQIFGLLLNEYREDIIDKHVYDLLTLESPDLTKHKAILKLSKNANNKPLVITTNFDYLFEKVDNKLDYWEAPLLPRHANLDSLSGIIYLHGRLAEKNNQALINVNNTSYPHSLILSSSDFGKAYLAEGWATNFIRYLLEQKTIILLGYSAEDPPVKYLLQGIRNSNLHPNTIYAFDGFDEKNTEETVKQKWVDLNVQPILYNKSKAVGKHSNLWRSLKLWANYADDLHSWQQSIIKMAQDNLPQNLKPYQRGQVATLISTIDGAKFFSEANPPVPPDWLYIFDNEMRYGEPYKEFLGSDITIDPLKLFNLDDDPNHSTDSEKKQVKGINFLSTLPNEQFKVIEGLSNSNHINNYTIKNKRITHLLNWYTRVSHEPIAIWWAINKQLTLHPRILYQVNGTLHREHYNKQAKIIWLWLSEIYQQHKSLDIYTPKHQWFDFIKILKFDGWSYRSLRYLETLLKPTFHLELSKYRKLNLSNHIDLLKIIHPKLEWTNIYRASHKITVPNEQLENVLNILINAFKYSLSFYQEPELESINSYYSKPNLNNDKDHYSHEGNDLQQIFNWTTELLKQYCETTPQQAKIFITNWPKNEPIFFNTLRIYVYLNTDTFSADEVSKAIIDLDIYYFESFNYRPYLLSILKKYWPLFSKESCLAIEEKIKNLGEDYTNLVGYILGYLEQQGYKLSQASYNTLKEFRADPDWNKNDELDMDQPIHLTAYRVATEPMDGFLCQFPISQIIDKANEYSKRSTFNDRINNEPFIGLVNTNPAKALSALIYQQKHNNFPIKYWQQLLENWPQENNQKTKRLTLVCGLRITQLPKKIILELSTYITRWIDSYLVYILDKYFNHFLSIWDYTLEALKNYKEEDNSYYNPEESIKSYSHALYSNIGQLTNTLLKLVGDLHLKSNQGIPIEYKKRFKKALTSRRLCASHVCSILVHDINYLYHIDQAWTTKILIPLFKLDNPLSQAAWYAFLYNRELPTSKLFHTIKPSFLKLPTKMEWFEEGGEIIQRQFGSFITAAIYYRKSHKNYLTHLQARDLLQRSTHATRIEALNQLHHMFREEKRTEYVYEFIEKIWPQELDKQTSETSHILIQIAKETPELFSNMIIVITPYLVTIDNIATLAYELNYPLEGKEESLTDLYPLEVLSILDKVISAKANYVYDLETILDKIAAKKPQVKNWPSWKRLRQL